jgi:ABC-type lipoprotein export system ATPase subunit
LQIFKKLVFQYDKCIIISTHSDFVANNADCVLSMNEGKII